MRLCCLVTLLLLIASPHLAAQKENNVWYFGNRAGVSFNGTTPGGLTNGMTSDREGGAVMSDPSSGTLLFYVDGDTVRDRYHQVMQNGTGLKGHWTSTQSSLIVPMPGEPMKYYVFSSDAGPYEKLNDGVHYSIVDLRLNSGRGAVTVKNVRLLQTAAEKLCAVRRCNGRDYWVIVHGLSSNSFHVFGITRSGISAPVISNVGAVEDLSIGWMKPSRNGKMLAVAFFGRNLVQLFDFDTASGRVSNPRSLTDVVGGGAYGVCFSPDNTKLYVSGYLSQLVQYDLAAPTFAEVLASRSLIPLATDIGSIQLGPDGKIYCAWHGRTWLSVIDQPNNIALYCGFRAEGVDLGTGRSLAGLPNIIDSDVPIAFSGADSAVAVCTDEEVTLRAWGGVDYRWSPADDLSCVDCASPTLTGGERRFYTVTISSRGLCPLTDTVWVDRIDPPLVAAPGAAICRGRNVKLRASGAARYEWTPALGLSCTDCAEPTASPDSTTIYVVRGYNAAGCVDSTTVTVRVEPDIVSLGEDRTLCAGDTVRLSAPPGRSYLWSPATGLSCVNCRDPLARPTQTTRYTVTVYSETGCPATGEILITVRDSVPKADAGGDVRVCAGDSVRLTATGGVRYQWTPADGLSCTDCPAPMAAPQKTTVYTVLVTNDRDCSAADQVTVLVDPLPRANAGRDRTICPGDSAQLVGSGGETYVWSPSEGLSCTDCATPYARPSVTTSYVLTATSAQGCRAADTVLVTVLDDDWADAGPTRVICGDSAQLTASDGRAWSWTPAEGLSCDDCRDPIARPLVTTTYRVTITSDGGCTASDTVSVFVCPGFAVGGDTAICAGDSVRLSATGATGYRWSPSDGLSCDDCPSPMARPTRTTTYVVTAREITGAMVSDSVTVTVGISADAGEATRICAGDSTRLTASAGTSWRWTPSDGLSCDDCRSPMASPSTTTTYSVTVTSGSCSDDDTVTVLVDPRPVADAGDDLIICSGESRGLRASGGISYRWSPSTGLNCTDCAEPLASPDSTTVYTVTAVGPGGCTSSDSVRVIVSDGAAMRARIGRDHRTAPGSSITVPLLFESAIDRAIDTLLVSLEYRERLLLLQGARLDDRARAGWHIETVEEIPGRITLRLISAPGRQAQTPGNLLHLTFHGFLGDSLTSELPFTISTIPALGCTRVETLSGRIRIDSICGLSLRLFELSTTKYALRQNSPNPFNPTTEIEFGVGLAGHTRLEIFNGAGERVALLVDEHLEAGTYGAQWDGSALPSGLYHYRLTSGEWSRTMRMLLVK